MIRIAFVEYNQETLRELYDCINIYLASHSSYAISSFSFPDGNSLINSIYEYGRYDFYFISTNLSNQSGIQLGKRVRELDSQARILFVSKDARYAVDSYTVPAIDYLTLPIDMKRVWNMLDSQIPKIRMKRREMLMIRNHERGEELIPFDEIRYIERSLRGMACHLTNGRDVESVTLRSSFKSAVSDLLTDSRFYLAGASLLLNLDHIRGMRQEIVLLSGGIKVIIPRRCISDLRTVWNRHWHQLDESESS